MANKKILSRFLSLLLAFCMAVPSLTAQAAASSSSDDPTTWPAPDSKYTAPGENPMYVFVNRAAITGLKITSSHSCARGGSRSTQEIVKATNTSNGYVKYTCDTCGSWAQVDVPMITARAFRIKPAMVDLFANGVEYSGASYYSKDMHDIAPEYQRFLGPEVISTGDKAVSDAGRYAHKVSFNNVLYDNVSFDILDDVLVIRPKAVPWTLRLSDKTYNGTSAIAGKSVSYSDINGQSIPVPLETFLASYSDGETVADTENPVAAPIAAGYYVVRAGITDKNYAWSNTAAWVYAKYIPIKIYPKVSPIYVGASINDVTYTTGGSSAVSSYNWSIDRNYSGFDSSRAGTTNVRFNVTKKDGTAMEQMIVPVTVTAQSIANVESVSRTAVMGTAFHQLNLPATLSVTTGSGSTVSVPVTWSSSGYNPYASSQTITGTLNASGISALNGANLPAARAAITLTEKTAQAPSISGYTKTYDGNATPLPLPSLPAGIQSAAVAYSGSGSTPPVNAGTYTATVSFTMDSGYSQVSSVTVSYTIQKAAQTCPKPTLSAKTQTSITLDTVQNAEYSKDGETWQDSPVFSGLYAGTSYTLSQRLKATSDGNYELSPAMTEQFTTDFNIASAPAVSDYAKTYDGQSTPLPLPAVTAGIQSMAVNYHGTTVSGNPYSGANPPVNAGNYTATVSFVMESGYAQLPSTTVTYTISRASQDFPEPALASATTTTLTLVAVDNAEYSMDGETWQDSPTFRNLDPGTTYTLYQRLKEGSGGNFEASPMTSGQFTTEYTTVNPDDLTVAIKPQTTPYTGSPVAYQVPAISHVTKSNVTYSVDGQTTNDAPTDAGIYPVTVSFTMQAGAAQLEPLTSTLTITKISQNAPSAPRAGSVGTNSITIAAIPGAVFSIDESGTWQDNIIFDGLTPDTAYTILAKYPGDRNHEESPVSSSVIRTTRQNASAGVVQSAVYTYDGTPKSLVADAPTGCIEVVQTFTGTNGAAYGPAIEPPVNPGVYNVKVSYTMQGGYEELQPQYATLTINKAIPAMPLAPVVAGVTDSSITIELVDGMAYSIDGGVTWQTTDTFTGLNRDTTYEIKVKTVETDCYKELEGPSTMQATKKTIVIFEGFADQTVEYTGNAQTYTLPKSVPGIASMTIIGYDGNATPPATVGDYVVNIDFVAAEGYKLPETLPAPVLRITRVSGEGGTVQPMLEDETVTYTGDPQRYHGADGIEGIASVALTYEGIDGTSYPETATAPTNAGVYHVTAIFSPDGNHTLAPGGYSATLTIRKAGQDTPMATLEGSSAHELTVSAIPGAEYSIDGGTTWQAGNTFSGLETDKDYTILVRMAEDENHTVSGTRPVFGRTTNQPVDVLDTDMPAYDTIYNGSRQPYPYTNLLTELEGVKSVSVMYVGALASGKSYESSEAPVDAGAYKVRFYLVAGDSYNLSNQQVYADMTISKAPQDMDTPPTIANQTTTTISLNPIPGAEYSVDGGETWQDSPRFTGLAPDTAYTFTQRMKETDNLTASESQSVEGQTIAGAGLHYEIDYRNEVIAFDPNVVEAWKDYALSDTLPSGGTITPGTTLYIRLVDDGTGTPGSVVMEVLPERPAAPDVKVNPFDFTMNTTTGMEYSDDSGETWKPCGDGQNVDDRQGGTLLVRIAATDDSFKSEATTVTVPVRGAAPVLAIDNATERMDSTAAMEYSKDNGVTWLPCLDNMDLSGLTNATLLVRYACDGTKPASNTATLAVPSRNAAPTANIDRAAERLAVSGAVPEYRTENGWTAIPANGLEVSSFYSKELAFREKYDTEHFASLPVLVKVPQKSAKPVVELDTATETVNTTTEMDYSTDGGVTWNRCAKPLDVSGMTGQTVIIRSHGNDAFFPSGGVSVKIPVRRKAPEVGHTDETRQGRNDGTLTKTDKTMEYRVKDGKWTAITANAVKGLAPGSYEVRYAATSSEMVSEIQKVTIATGGAGDLTAPGSKLSLLNRKDHIAYITGRTSTQAAPNADITRAEVAAILYRLLTTEAKSAYGTRTCSHKAQNMIKWKYGTEERTI